MKVKISGSFSTRSIEYRSILLRTCENEPIDIQKKPNEAVNGRQMKAHTRLYITQAADELVKKEKCQPTKTFLPDDVRQVGALDIVQ